MKKKLKRILALVLVAAMSLGLMNTPQFTASVQAANTTLYFYADGWSSAYLWAWDGYATSEWPGEALKKVEGTQGWWSITVTNNSFTGYVQETGNGTGCNASFTVSNAGEEVYVVYNGNEEIRYDSKEAAEQAAGESISGGSTPSDETFLFKFVDGTGNDISVFNAQFEVVVNETAYTLNAEGNGTWTATIPTNASTMEVWRKSPTDDELWTKWVLDPVTRGTNDTYTATSWSSDMGSTGTGQWGTVTSSNTFTFTLAVTENDWSANPIWVAVVDGGEEVSLNNVDGKFTAEIPADAKEIIVNRKAPDGGIWNKWTIDATKRGTETVYTVTAWAVYPENGSGQWGTPETPSDPTNIYGVPYEQVLNNSAKYQNMQLDSIEDTNKKNELIVVPAVMYNYIPSGGEDWWDQFNDLNKAMLQNYAGTGKITHPLVTGAFNNRTGNVVTAEKGTEGPLQSSTVDFNNQITMDNRLWYTNHNMASDGNGSEWNTALVGAPLQGLVADWLTENGTLLSSENNVIMPYFDDEFLTGRAIKYGSVDNPISFPFRVAGNGYYTFDSGSGQDNVYMNDDGKLVYNSDASAQIKNLTDDTTGFYPFNTTGTATTNAKHLDGRATSNKNLETNYGFGMRLDIPFNVPKKDSGSTEVTNNYNTAKVTLTNNWDTSTSNSVKLSKPIKSGQYLVVYNENGDNVNLDKVSIGSASYTVKQAISTNVTVMEGTNYGGDGIGHFQDQAGSYIVYQYSGEDTDEVDIMCRAYGDNYSFDVLVLDDYNSETITAAVEEMNNSTNDDIKFNFSGDDDLWVYIDGKLVLDMGGSHGKASGSINFTTGEVEVVNAKKIGGEDKDTLVEGTTSYTDEWLKFDPNETHTMTVFYMERGLYDSNLEISFNFSPVKMTQENGLTVTNKMDIEKINETLRDKVNEIMKQDGFEYEVKNITNPEKIPTFGGEATEGKFTFPGDGSATEAEKIESEDDPNENSIRGNQFTVEQTPDDRFNTSYSITDINGNEIKPSTSGTQATDERKDNNTVYLQNNPEETDTEEKVGVKVDYVNVANASEFTVEKKLEDGATDIAENTFTFEVKYTQFFGVAVDTYDFLDGSFAGLTYSVVSADDNTPIDGKQNLTLDADSRFTLKADEKAVFEGIPSKTQISVTEVDAANTFRKAEVSQSTTESENDSNILTYTDVPATIAADGQNNPAYVFVNGDPKRTTLVYYTEIKKETNLPLVVNDEDLTTENNIESFTMVANAKDDDPAEITIGDTKKTLSITTKHVGCDKFTLKLANASTNQIEYIDVVVYNYNLNDQIYVLDYGLPVHLLNGANGILGADGKQGYDYDNNLSVSNIKVLASEEDGDGLTKLGLITNAEKFAGVEYQYTDSDFVEKDDNGVQTIDFAQANLTASEEDVVYTLNKFMTQIDSFNYAVQVTKDGLNRAAQDASEGTNVMTCNVQVMPANIIYYEDNFAGSEVKDDGTHGIIYSGNVTEDGTSKNDSTQSNAIDMQYGYDPTYEAQGAGYSNGSAHNLGHGDTAAFEFHGTGFDIISRANSYTGTIIVSVIEKTKDGKTAEIVKDSTTGKLSVTNRQANMIQSMVVNTYYENGDMYQIPVITWRSTETEAKDYIVTITSYGGTDTTKTVYIDGLRIYNPLKSDISDEQYDKIHEKDAEIKEIKQLIFGEGYVFNYDNPLDSTFVNEAQATLIMNAEAGESVTYMLSGKTVVEATTEANEASKPVTNPVDPKVTSDLMTYAIQGPNNELYLNPNYGFGFNAKKTSDDSTLQIGVKNIKGGAVNGLELQYLSKQNQWVNLAFITSATENYYRLNTDEMLVNEDGSYRVVLRVKNGSDDSVNNIMSFTSVKVKGYTLAALTGDALFKTYSLNESLSVEGIDYYSGKDQQTGNIEVGTTVCYANIQTSTDIDRIAVKLTDNGEELKTVRANYKDVNGKRVWTIKFKASTTITDSFFIKLYNDDASEYSKTFEVDKNGGIR